MFFRRLFPYRTLWSWYKSFPLSALSVHRKSIVHFEKTIILGHLSWVKTIVYYFNSLKYFIEVSLSADQPAACLQPAFLIAGYQSLSTQLWALLCPSSQQNLQIQCAVSVACSAEVFRYPFPLLRIILAVTWGERTCLCPVFSAVFFGPLLTWPGKEEGWECILQAVGKKRGQDKN